MHWEALKFVSIVHDEACKHGSFANALEFGAYSVNYSVSDILGPSVTHFGVDLIAGRNISWIGFAHEFRSDEMYDLAISAECFEHDPHYEKSFINLVDHCDPMGLVVVSCASTNRPEHGTRSTDPNHSPGTSSIGIDHYRNLVEADFPIHFIRESLHDWFFTYNPQSCDLYFVGIKNVARASLLQSIRARVLDFISSWNKILQGNRPIDDYLEYMLLESNALSSQQLLPKILYSDDRLPTHVNAALNICANDRDISANQLISRLNQSRCHYDLGELDKALELITAHNDVAELTSDVVCHGLAIMAKLTETTDTTLVDLAVGDYFQNVEVLGFLLLYYESRGEFDAASRTASILFSLEAFDSFRAHTWARLLRKQNLIAATRSFIDLTEKSLGPQPWMEWERSALIS